MADWKPELDWLDSPEIHRQEILDLIPRESPNGGAFTDALIGYISQSHIQPDIISVLKTLQKGNSLLRKARRKLKTLKKINIETGQEIRKWIEDTTDPEKVSRSFSTYVDKFVQIDSLIRQLELDIDLRTRGVPEDARIKEIESRLVEATLAFWKMYFPENTLPTRAMQGRRGGEHEPCKPAQLCQLVLEFAIGIKQDDISHLFEKAIQRMNDIDQSPGTLTLLL